MQHEFSCVADLKGDISIKGSGYNGYSGTDTVGCLTRFSRHEKVSGGDNLMWHLQLDSCFDISSRTATNGSPFVLLLVI